MSAQLKLLEVAPDRPTKARQLKAFKSCFDIRTHYCGAMSKEEGRWLAVKPAKEHRKLTLFDLFSKYGMLYEESDQCAYANTEITAVKRLCDKLSIQFDL